MKRMLVVALAVLLAGCSSEPAVGKAPTADLTCMAYTLSEMFESNDEEAEKSILGKVVEVSGAYSKTTSTGEIYLDRESTMGFIICKMSKDDASDYSNLKRGDAIRIVGTVKGEFGHVNMEDCWYLGVADQTSLVPGSSTSNSESSKPLPVESSASDKPESTAEDNSSISVPQAGNKLPTENEQTEEIHNVVYWGATGTKYHINPKCRSLKDEAVSYGTLEDAKAVRDGWCGICSKRWTDDEFLKHGNPNK